MRHLDKKKRHFAKKASFRHKSLIRQKNPQFIQKSLSFGEVRNWPIDSFLSKFRIGRVFGEVKCQSDARVTKCRVLL